ncbi:MAG: CBS domain-containing protein [Pseudomonadota bacterium]
MEMYNLTARDLMKTDVKRITKNKTLPEAVALMGDFNVSSLLVEAENENDAYGIITRKDIVEVLFSERVGWESFLVEDVMSKPAITANANLSIANCQQLMRMVGVRRLPIVDGDKVVGILSNTDIFMKLLEK